MKLIRGGLNTERPFSGTKEANTVPTSKVTSQSSFTSIRGTFADSLQCGKSFLKLCSSVYFRGRRNCVIVTKTVLKYRRTSSEHEVNSRQFLGMSF